MRAPLVQILIFPLLNWPAETMDNLLKRERSGEGMFAAFALQIAEEVSDARFFCESANKGQRSFTGRFAFA